MPPPTTPPAFKKKNHHYVPRFWLRGFRDAANQIWRRRDGKIKPASQDHLMSEDWLYTIFDDWWRPSDALEDAFAGFEATAANTFRTICVQGAVVGEQDWRVILEFLGLTVCRHPDAMRRGHSLGKEMSWVLADVQGFADREAFFEAIKATFGIDCPSDVYDFLSTAPEDALLEAADLIDGLLPQDPQLPEQDAIKATIMVGNAIASMDLDIVDAPAPHSFILGDRPLPLKNLGEGFSVPLSSTVAVLARPVAAGQGASQHRRAATAAEVDEINREQLGRCKSVVIGADRAMLQAL